MTRQKPRILIVEDHDVTATLIGVIFEAWGLITVCASTVAGAKASLDIPLDAILLDLMLPDGPGVEVLRAVRKMKLAVPVVVWTARPLQDLADVVALGPELILAKPSSMDELKAVVERAKATFEARARP